MALDKYRQAVEGGEQGSAPWAALTLANELRAAGDAAGAEAALREALGSGHAGIIPWAANALGVLLNERGEHLAAKETFHRAVQAGDPLVSPIAALNLAIILWGEGDGEWALAALEPALEADQPDVVAVGAFLLGQIMLANDEVDEAREAFELSLRSGASPAAALTLGLLLEAGGGADEAMHAVADPLAFSVVPGGPTLSVTMDEVGCGRREARGVLHGLRALAATGRPQRIELIASDEIVRDEVRRAGFVGRLRAPLVYEPGGRAGPPTPVAASHPQASDLARRLEVLVPGIRVGTRATAEVVPLRARMGADRKVPVVMSLVVELPDGGPELQLSLPARRDLLVEAVAHALDTVVAVRRRFGAALHGVRHLSFEFSERGLRSGTCAGVARPATTTIRLDAAGALAEELERRPRLRWSMAAGRAAPVPFAALEETVAHELWHTIEAHLEVGHPTISAELHRQLGAYFGVQTLEQAVEGGSSRSPAPWQRARAVLLEEVSAYAGTSPSEASAEMFRLWWLDRDAPPPVARHFGAVVDRILPAGEA